MPAFRHRFRVRAPLEVVVDFHRKPAGLAAITPPPLRLTVREAPTDLTVGGEVAFTLGLGPLSLQWRARIDERWRWGFVDRQLVGPFARWVHRHEFVPLSPDCTEVIDRVELAFRPHPVWGPVGVAMWLGLPVLFAYRAWKTRRLLARAN